MSYSRFDGNGAWYIYRDIGGWLQVYFGKDSDRYTDGAYLRIHECKHVVPLLAGLADQLRDNLASGSALDEDDWADIISAHDALSRILEQREAVASAGPSAC